MSNASARRPGDELRARILAEVARTSAPSRREYRRRLLLVTGGGVATTLALFLVLGGLVVGERPWAVIACDFIAALAPALVLTSVSFLGTRSMLGRPKSVLVAASVATVCSLIASIVAVSLLWPSHEEIPTRAHLGCTALTLVQGGLLLAGFAIPRRNAYPVHPVATGFTIGMAAGAWAVAIAYLRCPHTTESHCVGAHVVPALLLAVIGGVLGRAFLRVRAQRGTGLPTGGAR